MILTEQTIDGAINFLRIPGSYFLIITGLIGNMINILMFSQLTLFRRNQSAFYLTIAAIFESLILILITLVRAIGNSFGYDPTQTSLIWCKLRIYLAQYGSMVAIITVCFAAIDQYLSTSYHIQLRRISTFKLAQHLVSILMISAAFYSIPILIFQEIHSNAGCAIYDPAYNYYLSFVQFSIVLGLFPIVVSSLFSVLAYRNVRHIILRQIPIIRRRLDRQLTAMILIRVALFVSTTLPYVSVRTYQINRPVDQNKPYLVAIEQLIKTAFTSLFTVNFMGSFYVFLISSTRYRRQVKYLFCKKRWRNGLFKQIHPNRVATEIQMETHGSRIFSIEVD